MKILQALTSYALLFIFIGSTSFSTKSDSIITDNLGSWVELGKQVASKGADYDRLEVAKSEESFKQLKFKVLKTPIYIRSIQIIYTDDTSENHIITRQFKKKQSSRTFDLAGHGRFIKTILFTYRTRTYPKVPAELVVMARNK